MNETSRHVFVDQMNWTRSVNATDARECKMTCAIEILFFLVFRIYQQQISSRWLLLLEYASNANVHTFEQHETSPSLDYLKKVACSSIRVYRNDWSSRFSLSWRWLKYSLSRYSWVLHGKIILYFPMGIWVVQLRYTITSVNADSWYVSKDRTDSCWLHHW